MALLSRAAKIPALLLVLASCSGVPIRPDGSPGDEQCPDGAREAMESFDLRPGSSVVMYVDANQRRSGPLIVYDGPIVSETAINIERLPGQTKLYGRVWTGGPRVIIRYYSAQVPGGDRIPFCAVAGWNGPGLPKSPGRPGSAALEDTQSEMFITGQFR